MEVSVILAIMSFTAGIFVGSVIAVMGQENCPRELLGYKHRDRGCDHSPKAFAEAYDALSKQENKK